MIVFMAKKEKREQKLLQAKSCWPEEKEAAQW
jgi:hypothetical protein